MNKIQQALRYEDGAVVILPPYAQGESGYGQTAIPNVYKQDTVQQYPAGTKYVEGERVFYYDKFIGTITGVEWIVALQAPNSTGLTVTQGRFLFAHVFQQDYANGLLVRMVADESSIWYQTTTSEAQADDYYSGGWVNGKDTGDNNRPFYRRIVAHNYTASLIIPGQSSADSDVSELQLDQPVETSKTTMATTIMPNPHKHCIYKSHSEWNQYAPAMGAVVPNVVAQNSWVWLQTYGPMGIPWAAVEFSGAGNYEIMYKISGDGSVSGQHSAAPTPADGSTFQVAGEAMASSIMESASGQDEELAMIFLKLRR